MTGGPQDGRKGHLVALFAFDHFLRSSYQANPDRYRPFSLSFVGLGDDYVSEHCRRWERPCSATASVPTRGCRTRRRSPWRTECNAVICCSFNEAFPLYVAEGMAMGHVVVRNDAGGVDEQLVDGVNGYRIDSDDIVQIAGVIEQMLNREKTSGREAAEDGPGLAGADRALPGPFLPGEPRGARAAAPTLGSARPSASGARGSQTTPAAGRAAAFRGYPQAPARDRREGVRRAMGGPENDVLGEHHGSIGPHLQRPLGVLEHPDHRGEVLLLAGGGAKLFRRRVGLVDGDGIGCDPAPSLRGRACEPAAHR